MCSSRVSDAAGTHGWFAASVLPQARANENVSQKNANTVVYLPQGRVYAVSGTDAHPWTRHQRGTMAACSHPVFNMPLACLFGEAEIMTFATCRWHLADGLNPAKKANRQDVRMCSQTKTEPLCLNTVTISVHVSSQGAKDYRLMFLRTKSFLTDTRTDTDSLLPKIISHTFPIIFWLVPITPVQFCSSQRCVTEYLPNWNISLLVLCSFFPPGSICILTQLNCHLIQNFNQRSLQPAHRSK